MVEYFTAVITTLVLTGLCALAFIRADIEGIRSNWNTRRCEFPIMLMAGMLKPPDDPRTGSDFSRDNFSFCIDKIILNVARVGTAPLAGVIKQQGNTTTSLASPMNNLRGMIANGVNTFKKVLDKQYRQFSSVSASVLKGWTHLRFAMGRISGIVLSILYTILSTTTLALNLIDYTIKAIITFLIILIVLLILLWFVLFPKMPIILSVIVVMMAAGIGAAAGMASSFCVDPNSEVFMADGKKKRIKDIEIGDLLETTEKGENCVTGKLVAETSNAPLVSLEGILMSGSHSVKYKDKWILAKDHPLAQKTSEKLPRLICLNTTQHEVILNGENNKKMIISDWEEISDEEGRRDWIDMVFRSLNPTIQKAKKYPTAVPLLSLTTKVISEKRGLVPINTVEIGESIFGENGFTKVVGIYEGCIRSDKNHPEWISDGTWFRSNGGFWTTATGGLKDDSGAKGVQRGLSLVTDSEVYRIQYDKSFVLVRDFTEIGASEIDKTYDTLNLIMNKK
jgi:hypothetical protein